MSTLLLINLLCLIITSSASFLIPPYQQPLRLVIDAILKIFELFINLTTSIFKFRIDESVDQLFENKVIFLIVIMFLSFRTLSNSHISPIFLLFLLYSHQSALSFPNYWIIIVKKKDRGVENRIILFAGAACWAASASMSILCVCVLCVWDNFLASDWLKISNVARHRTT